MLNVTGDANLKDTLGKIQPFRYRGYVYDVETGLYYLRSRYYNQDIGRFINADIIIEGNIYCYCQNKTIRFSDDDGLSSITSIIENAIDACAKVVTEIVKSFVIEYDVPLYTQGKTKLCWAFCQVMVEDYNNGIVSSQTDAESRAKAISIAYHQNDQTQWNNGGWPTNSSYPTNKNSRIDSPDLVTIIDCLKQYGPIYAYYKDPNGTSAHLVVITGANLLKDTVSINNPQGYYGEQSYQDFLNGYLGMPSNINRKLKFILLPK